MQDTYTVDQVGQFMTNWTSIRNKIAVIDKVIVTVGYLSL